MLGEQLQHLPEALHLPQLRISGLGVGLIELPHQGLGFLDCQLTGTALQPLEVVQQGREVLVRDLGGKRTVLRAGAWGS